MNLRKLVYIQVYEGHFLARIVGETTDVRHDCSGLKHPRTLAGDFETIEKGFKDALGGMASVNMKLFAPKILVHLVPPQEGGVTSIELRAFREAAISAGSTSDVLLVADGEGPKSDEEIRELF